MKFIKSTEKGDIGGQGEGMLNTIFLNSNYELKLIGMRKLKHRKSLEQATVVFVGIRRRWVEEVNLIGRTKCVIFFNNKRG